MIVIKYLYSIVCTFLGALRKLHPTVNIKEYKSVLVNWFDEAKNRNGGRKRRSAENV